MNDTHRQRNGEALRHLSGPESVASVDDAALQCEELSKGLADKTNHRSGLRPVFAINVFGQLLGVIRKLVGHSHAICDMRKRFIEC